MPKTGFAVLKAHFKDDLSSGFSVSLIAMQKAAPLDGRTLEFSGLEELVPATFHKQSERTRKNG